MTTVDRRNPLPLWAQVLVDLRRRLAAGEFADAFPTDDELTRHYGVSRHTARDAVRRLTAEGVLTRERGRGTFVTAPTIEQPTGALYSLFRSIEDTGARQRSEVLDLGVRRDADVAARLDLPARAALVRLERLRSAIAAGGARHVFAHDVAWLPAEVARPLLHADFSHTGLYDELHRRCGVRPTAATEWIGADVASADDRARLGIGAKQAVFRIERLSHLRDRPLEWRTTTVRGDRFRFVTTWSPDRGYGAVLAARHHAS